MSRFSFSELVPACERERVDISALLNKAAARRPPALCRDNRNDSIAHDAIMPR